MSVQLGTRSAVPGTGSSRILPASQKSEKTTAPNGLIYHLPWMTSDQVNVLVEGCGRKMRRHIFVCLDAAADYWSRNWGDTSSDDNNLTELKLVGVTRPWKV